MYNKGIIEIPSADTLKALNELELVQDDPKMKICVEVSMSASVSTRDGHN